MSSDPCRQHEDILELESKLCNPTHVGFDSEGY